MYNKNCVNFLIISLSSLLIISILYFSYFIAFIKNRIIPIEDIIYIVDNRNYIEKFKYYNSIYNSFNNGQWIIKQDIKYYKSHSYIYIDYQQNKIIYVFFYLFKILSIGIITGLQSIIDNNTIISFSAIGSIYLIDIILLLLFNPYKNVFINIINLFSNISISIVILLLIFTNDEKNIMHIVDITFIIFCFIILFELVFIFFARLYLYLAK
jgi:hypothetical protein